jgi:hypothetical protein
MKTVDEKLGFVSRVSPLVMKAQKIDEDYGQVSALSCSFLGMLISFNLSSFFLIFYIKMFLSVF